MSATVVRSTSTSTIKGSNRRFSKARRNRGGREFDDPPLFRSADAVLPRVWNWITPLFSIPLPPSLCCHAVHMRSNPGNPGYCQTRHYSLPRPCCLPHREVAHIRPRQRSPCHIPGLSHSSRQRVIQSRPLLHPARRDIIHRPRCHRCVAGARQQPSMM
jgi:hypothetical protein